MVHLHSAFNQGSLHGLCIAFIHSHTYIHTPMADETMQGTSLLTGSILGFRVSLKDSSTKLHQFKGCVIDRKQVLYLDELYLYKQVKIADLQAYNAWQNATKGCIDLLFSLLL